MNRQRILRAAMAAMAAALVGASAVKLVRRSAAKRWVKTARKEIKAGDLPWALDSVRRAAKLDPGSAQARFLLGNALLLSGKPDEAVGHLEASLEDLELPEIYFDLGLGYSQLGDVKAARRWFKEAEPRLRKAFAADPRDMKTLRMLGVLFLKTERPRKALDCFIKLAAAVPGDAGTIRVLEEIRREGLPERKGEPL